ncbi:MAG: lipid-A-disaccharide synthase [Myxococcota bacterium]
MLLSVGDASGDVVASDFVRELAALRPGTRFVGLGGSEMAAAGVELLVDQSALAVGGLVELAPDLAGVVGAWRKMVNALRVTRPDLVVLVDSSGFNLPFAKRAKRLGIPTLYYVAPQVWGWRTGRIRKIAKRVSRLAVIFPFEPEVYAGTGVPVEYVGHPLAERIESARRLEPAAAREGLGLPAGAPIVALLPGSRRAEMRHLLPLQLAVAKTLHARDPRLHFVLPRASSLEKERIDEGLREAALPSLLPLTVVEGRAQEVLRAADVALCKPGTSTLEAALLGCPLVVAARSSWLTSVVLRRLVQVESLAMPNLIAGETVVPEFYQQEADPERIADALQALLDGPARDAQRERLAGVAESLSRGGAARRAAEIAASMIVERLPA